MTTVYRKTDKGQHEIDTRTLRLPPRLRTALILVDGRRSDAELAAMIAVEPAQTLQALLDQGLIEAVPGGASRRASEAAAPAAAPAPESEPPAPSTLPPPAQRDFAQHRREAVRHMTDQLGPMAEAIALRMEKSANWAQLLPALQVAQQILGNTRGSAAAAEFSRRFIDNPPA